MSTLTFDSTTHERLSELGQRVIDGGEVNREEAMWLFELSSTADIFELMAWANRKCQQCSTIRTLLTFSS